MSPYHQAAERRAQSYIPRTGDPAVTSEAVVVTEVDRYKDPNEIVVAAWWRQAIEAVDFYKPESKS